MTLKRAYSKTRPSDADLAQAMARMENPSLNRRAESSPDLSSLNPDPPEAKSSSLEDIDIDNLDPSAPASIPDELPSALRRSNAVSRLPDEPVLEDPSQATSKIEDIFDWVDATVIRDNRCVKYKVMKEGQFVGYLPHPLTWDKIQETYGGGTFQVQAIALDTSEVVKKQTMTIAAVPRMHSSEGQRTIIQQSPQQDGKMITETMKSVMEIMKLMQPADGGKSPAAPSSSMEQLLQLVTVLKTLGGGQQDSGTASMTAILEVVRAQNQQSQTMFLEIAKMSQTMTEKLMQSTQALVGEMNSKIERLEEKRSAEMSKLLEMVMESRESDDDDKPNIYELQQQALENAMKQMEMIDERANRKAQLMAQDAGIIPPPEKPSLTDRVIEGALPLLTGLLAARGGGAVPSNEPLPAAAMPTTAKAQPPQQLPQAAVPVSQPSEAQIRADERRRLIAEMRARQQQRAPQPQPPAQPEPAPAAPESEMPAAAIPSASAPRPKPRKALQMTDEQLVEKYQAVIASVVGSYTGSASPQSAADSLRGLISDLPTFMREAPGARIEVLLRKNGVSDDAIFQYVREVYAHLNHATNGAAAKPV